MSVQDIILSSAGTVVSGGSGVVSDPSTAKYVSLLLNGDGTNGSQNQTFIDSSTNNATITRYGDATQGSFGPFGNSWSNYFDGTGDYLSLPSSSNYAFGTGDFTVEYWIYMTGGSTAYGHCVFDTRAVNGNATGIAFSTMNNGAAEVYSNAEKANAGTAPLNTWNHYAFVRSSGTMNAYINGSQVWSIAYTDNLTDTVMLVGTNNPKNTYVNGYISNLRIVKGTALYTTNFTPSTTPLTAISGTSLLTCQSNRFVDNSTNNAAITAYGDTKVVKDSPFPEVYDNTVHGASAYFDGTGDYLSLPSSTNFDFSTGNFTIELWYRSNTSTENAHATFVACYQGTAGATSTNSTWSVKYSGSTGYIEFSYYNGTWGDQVTTVGVSDQAWHHLAVTRSGTDLRIFKDGTVVKTVTGFNIPLTGAGNNCTVGWQGQDAGSYINGCISNLRIVKGTALYTSNFTPATAPLTAVANTSLLLKCDNAGIYDATGKNDLVTYGNAQISTSTKKYGTGAMYFYGTGDYLTTPITTALKPGTGDFTLECWVFPTAYNTAYPTIIDIRTGRTQADGIFALSSTGKPSVLTTSNAWVSTASTVPLNTWTHIVFVKSSGTTNVYINGVKESATIPISNISSTSANAVIGQVVDNNNAYGWIGYIDDLRITKGVARYTANFTPPTATLTL